MVRLVLVCEVADANTVEEAQAKLDAFREAVLPEQNYGLTLYHATEQNADVACYADTSPEGWENG